MNVSRLASDLGISRPTLYKYKQEGMPLDTLDGARSWVESRKAADGRGGSGTKTTSGVAFLALKEDLLRANVRKTEAEAALREAEQDITERNLVSVAEAKLYISEILGPLRALLDALPAAAAPRCNPSDPALAEVGIREALEQVFRAMDQASKDEAQPNG